MTRSNCKFFAPSSVEDPEAAGRKSFSFSISEAGDVVAAQVVESTVPERMDTCVVSALQRWKFPAPSQGSVTVTHPFAFEPG